MINQFKNQIYKFYGNFIKESNVDRAEAAIVHFGGSDESAKQKIRTERLLTILRRAYQEVPYYRELFDKKDLKFSGPESLKFFTKIPILTKKLVRENFKNIQNKHLNELNWHTSKTGGSTGSPLIFIIDKEFDDIKYALRNYQIKINGKKDNDTVIKLWGFYHYDDRPMGILKHSVANWLQNRVDLNSLYLSEEVMASLVKRIKSEESVFIEAYAQSAYQLAKYINRNAIEINNVSAIIPSASTLFDFMREEIEKAFKCNLYNRYGAMEASVIAFERNHQDGLSVSTSQYIVEVIDENGQHCRQGEEGDVIITNFSNFAFPFIRYQIGDRAIVKEVEQDPVKSCISLKNVTGRISEVFLKEDGSLINSYYLWDNIERSAISGWIEKMQIVQMNYREIQINIVKFDHKPVPAGEIQQIRKTIQKMLGKDCRIDFNFVDQIEVPKSGKYQYAKSLINKNADFPNL